MQARTEFIIDGAGRLIINPSCSGGSITIRGHFPEPTGLAAFLLAGGTYTDNARWAEDQRMNSLTNGYVTVTGTVVASSVTGNVGGTVQAVVDGYVTVTGTVSTTITGYVQVTGTVVVGTNNDKTDYVLSAVGVTAITDDVFAEQVEGTLTFKQWVRRVASVLFGKASGGGAVGSKKFRDMADAVDRVDATTDANGNRTSVT